ncbi:MAG: TolC family outer membrane protein [Pseudomonadota bacterium]
MAVAANNSVDLQSADGMMFLQSAHTGFLEASPGQRHQTVAREAPRRRAPQPIRTPGRGGLYGSGHRVAGTAPEMGDRSPIRHIAPPNKGRKAAPHQTRHHTKHGTVPPGRDDLPHILVRPAVDPRGARTLTQAVESAYDSNPTINQARANLRAADENIAIAKSGNRPTVTGSISTGLQHVRDVNDPTGAFTSGTLSETRAPAQLALDVSQPLFRGFRTRNATREAEANVRAERERLRATEQDVFLNTAIAFVDVRRFREGERLRQREVDFLAEQVTAARSRQEFGEGTRTDVDQAEARLAEARATLADEISSKAEAEARFRQLTGLDPKALKRDIDPTKLLPSSLSEALRRAQDNSPNVKLAIHEADEAIFNVKELEGQALPTLSLTGQLATDIDTSDSDRTEAAEVRLVLQVPLYQGGQVSAQVRQAKESLGSARIAVDLARDEVRSDISSGWATYRASLETIRAARSSVAAATRAVAGVLEELRVGQRTTLDVLNAQRDLVRAEVTLAEAIRQRDGASFVVLRSMGELDIGMFGLNVTPYDPREHYKATKDRWAGMRTPDGQ